MADGSLGQDDIDKLLSDLGADSPAAPPAKPPTAAASKPPTAVVAKSAASTKPPEDGALDQDAIDALIAQASEVAESPKPETAKETATAGHLDQTEIDKLLAELDPHTRKSKVASSASAQLSQNDIERLLSELDVPAGGSNSNVMPATTAGAKAPAPSAPAAPAAAPVAAPVAAAAAPPAKAASGEVPDGPLSQEDIDKMLSQLGASTPSLGASKTSAAPPAPVTAADGPAKTGRTIPPAPEPVAAKPADVTQALSPEEIDAIVAKQGSDALPGTESEAVIAQSDIDALVKQLAQATGAPEAQEVADAIAGKAADIDRLQEGGQQAGGPDLTRDAVDVNSVLGHTASTAALQMHGGQVQTFNVATVGVGEWRWGQYLLIAAVLMLGICSGVLIMLTMSVSHLSGELKAAREVEHPAVDGYADKLRLALAKLSEGDEAERARGVRWMEELKRQHPDKAADIGVSLARHFRGREAWRRAADEYGAALEAAGGVDDPQVPLEHADCLARLGDNVGAIRQIYVLLSSEARWLSERDADGRAVPGRERNRQSIADAYLMLGRLLQRDRSGRQVATTSVHDKPAVQPSAPAGHDAHSGGH